MVEEVNAAIQRHRCVPEVISACCAALTVLEVFYSPQSEVRLPASGLLCGIWAGARYAVRVKTILTTTSKLNYTKI